MHDDITELFVKNFHEVATIAATPAGAYIAKRQLLKTSKPVTGLPSLLLNVTGR